MTKTIFLLIAAFISHNSLALVDYSNVEGSSSSFKPNNRPKAANKIKRNAPKAARAATKSGPTSFELLTSFEQQDVSGDATTGDISKVSFQGHFQTQYNLYLDFSYWAASNGLSTHEGPSSYDKGRPEFILGFNWLRFGAIQEMATVDIYGGATFAGSEEIASTRTDKIIGVETSKRFYNFAIAIGYEYVISGTPKNSEELTIGNINTLKTTLGWVVSGDISFVLEGGMVSIDNAQSSESSYKLLEDSKFSYLRPSVNLGLSPTISLEMGGVFRTRSAKDVDTLVDAKLWNVPGAYGNSLFAGLKFSI
jgi:hypothetical protein